MRAEDDAVMGTSIAIFSPFKMMLKKPGVCGINSVSFPNVKETSDVTDILPAYIDLFIHDKAGHLLTLSLLLKTEFIFIQREPLIGDYPAKLLQERIAFLEYIVVAAESDVIRITRIGYFKTFGQAREPFIKPYTNGI